MISIVATRERQQAAAGAGQPGRAASTWTTAVVVCVALAAVLVVATPLGDRLPSSTSAGEPPAWRENLALILCVVALVPIVVASVRMLRAGVLGAAHRARGRSISIQQRCRAMRWIRRGDQVPEATMPVALETARALVGQHRGAPARVGLVLLFAGQALQSTNPWWVALSAAAAVATAASEVMIGVRTHQARRWLDARPRQTTGDVVGA